jgi:enamine deaminase RidA (YjgF/YER057c/UK114 family)
MSLENIAVDGWKAPRGYANGVFAPANSRLLAVAGQIAWDAEQRLVSSEFAAQFRQALANVVAVVRAAGGAPADLMSLTIFVTDKHAYLASVKELGAIWKEVVGRHYPAMALVEVAALLEEGAQVEIQALAAIGTANPS